MAEESDATRNKDHREQQDKPAQTTAPGPEVTSPADAQRFVQQSGEQEDGESKP
jgi:hypothetical protein